MLQFLLSELLQKKKNTKKKQDFIKVKETFAHFCPVEGMGTTQSLLIYEGLYFQRWIAMASVFLFE